MQFPRLVYRSASVYELADDSNQHEKLLSEGWFASVPEAMAPKAPEKVEPEGPATRAELEAKATELGIKFNGRTKDAGLARMIEQALHVVD
jgi:hypothetical protein